MESGGALGGGGAMNGSAAASGRFAPGGTAALGALMALLIAVTVAGNALVMLAFVADSSLRTQNNFFLLNLAISDFLVGKVPPRRAAPGCNLGTGRDGQAPGLHPSQHPRGSPLLPPAPLCTPGSPPCSPGRAEPAAAALRPRGSCEVAPGPRGLPSCGVNGPLRLQVPSAFPCTCPMC